VKLQSDRDEQAAFSGINPTVYAVHEGLVPFRPPPVLDRAHIAIAIECLVHVLTTGLDPETVKAATTDSGSSPRSTTSISNTKASCLHTSSTMSYTLLAAFYTLGVFGLLHEPAGIGFD
jgi:hypothetical protein